MKKSYLLWSVALILIILFAACRDPSLEQAIIDYKGSRWDQAYESIQKSVKKVPSDPEAWYYYGEIAGKRGEVKQMVEAFDKSLELKDTFKAEITSAKNSYFSKFYNSGVQSYNTFIKTEDKESENAQQASKKIIEEFEKALIIRNDYQANRLIANAYRSLNDEENQIKYLNLAAESNPDTALAWIELGFLYRINKDYDKAADYFKKAIDVDPKNTTALTMFAECLDFSGKKDEAISAYKNAVEVNPQEKAIPFNLGLLLYKEANKEGLEDSQRKQYLNEAEIYFKKAYDLDPEFKELYDLYGPVLIHNKKYDIAETVLLEGTKRFPDAASIWTNLSIVYANKNKVEKANEAAKKAKELSN
ncbi:tetratricopeptide repeat protein [Calditrichota bacterium]